MLGDDNLVARLISFVAFNPRFQGTWIVSSSVGTNVTLFLSNLSIPVFRGHGLLALTRSGYEVVNMAFQSPFSGDMDC